ncbi:TetR/AcrR family transcriptional regulator [Nocardia fusca]|uniref:TetR/AcrR family transcriptional regulator n=1 Tax=Nocardia fusca TaxID=941183 RepID=UPI0037A45C25
MSPDRTISTPPPRGAPSRRSHTAGNATRTRLLDAAEALMAERGIEGVPLSEIRNRAGQSNSSAIAYHFGSKDGLVRALVLDRQLRIDEERARMIDELVRTGRQHDPRSVVWVVVRPLANTVREGSRYAAFLARLSEQPEVRTRYWPQQIGSSWNNADLQRLIADSVAHLPERVRRSRSYQTTNSVLNLLGEHARTGRNLSEVRLLSYIDGWVGMLTAPVSTDTAGLLPD